MLVGEAPGEHEVMQRQPFVGASGQELNRMLHEAGILRSECFCTNVCRERPPDNEISAWLSNGKRCPDPLWTSVNGKWAHPYVASGYLQLLEEVRLVRPNVIIALGNAAMWALTGKWGIKSWRGSLLTTPTGVKVLPAYHPAYILRDWAQRTITIHDLKRAKAQASSPLVPSTDYFFVIRPSYSAVAEFLAGIEAQLAKGPTTIAVDIETRAGHLACLGLALDTRRALCIPFMCTEREDGYWNVDEEVAIICKLQALLCHENARVIGQNFIYDAQYIYRHWRFVPRFARDTMLGHHVCFAGMPKGLDFLSSMYCENHVYWKDEGKTWDQNTGEEQLWAYNCKDAVITFECDIAIQATVDRLGLREPHDAQQRLFWPVLEAMVRGVRVDLVRRENFATELRREISAREAWFGEVLGHPLNPRSPRQMKLLFYGDLAQKEIFNRKTGTITLNDEALQKMAQREPMLRPLVRRITEHRSLGVFLSTFVGARLDKDQRLRCSYNIAGTETFRLSSSANAFDSGLNLQNIPKGGGAEEELQLPNVRKLFVPDNGFTFFDCDLDRADLQVVVWEADDDELKHMLLEGADIHEENARLLRIPRQLAKTWVHGTNYGGSPRTMAINCGISLAQAESMRTRWFSAHPGIARWHRRTEETLRSTHAVTNRFGYRRFYFDRIDSVLPEALAWQPQSTVAIVINKIWQILFDEQSRIQVLLQVHDSLAGQFPTIVYDESIEAIRGAARRVIVPYPIPLCIPLGIKTSTTSWGDCA
jgi:DNA polymerase I-like protein with 3'-5' exonuclease and polymerase domains/uracil-DNA glycosylase